MCRVAGGEVSRAVQGAAACWDNKTSTWGGDDMRHKGGKRCDTGEQTLLICD